MSSLRFYYEGSSGVQERFLKKYTFSRSCVSGYCHKSNAYKSFRLDRIKDVLEGSIPSADELDAINRRACLTNHKRKLEICFTGFKSDLKAELKRIALLKGFVVRTGATENLDFLCCGGNAGPSKIDKALSIGAFVLSEEQFRELIESGALPT